MRYGVSVVSALNKRNEDYAKLVYHAERINEAWVQLDQAFLDEEREIIEGKIGNLVIA